MISRAFGKVILLGEHAVVYGVPALAVGIDRGAVARAQLAETGLSTITLQRMRAVSADDDTTDLALAFRHVLKACDVTSPLHVEVETDLPAAAGLGCSAALGVAVVRAVEDALGRSPTTEQVVERAMAWERVFHGNPSGVDAVVAVAGGHVLYARGDAPEVLVAPCSLHLAIGHTGIASPTKGMVDGVARLRQRRPDAVEKTFAAIHALVRNARLALEAGDTKALGELLDMNQMLLAGLFVSTTEIERLCHLARGAGALGAKLTGAGGGGCVLALCEGACDEVLAAWKQDGFEGFATTVHPTERAVRWVAPVCL